MVGPQRCRLRCELMTDPRIGEPRAIGGLTRPSGPATVWGVARSRTASSGMVAPRPADLSSGWIIVAAAIVIVGLGVGALFSLAVFLKPMQDSMEWSRAAISGVALWMWAVYGIGSLMWGVLADRWGAR